MQKVVDCCFTRAKKIQLALETLQNQQNLDMASTQELVETRRLKKSWSKLVQGRPRNLVTKFLHRTPPGAPRQKVGTPEDSTPPRMEEYKNLTNSKETTENLSSLF